MISCTCYGNYDDPVSPCPLHSPWAFAAKFGATTCPTCCLSGSVTGPSGHAVPCPRPECPIRARHLRNTNEGRVRDGLPPLDNLEGKWLRH